MSASHLFMAAPSNMCYMRIQSPRDFIFQAGIWYCETTTMDLLVVVHYPVRNSTRRIKSRFSEVPRTLPYPPHKIQLILTILTVVSLFPYLFWGMRNGSCCFSVYMFFLGIPWTYPDVLYIAGKIFLRGIQRSWNRGKRFSGDGVIRRTSLTNMAHRGE